MNISLYGGTGFVGNTFYWRETTESMGNLIYKIPRWKRKPEPNTDILYMISTTHNYNVFEDATIDINTNLMVLAETLDSWRHNNPENTFNFISSWFVFGNEYSHYGTGATEHDNCHPRGFYSITKRTAEKLLISYADIFGLKYRILRLANVIGKGDNGVSAKKNALQYLINEMIAGRDINVYERGDFYRNYIHVHDACYAIRMVMERGAINDIYNIGLHNCRFIDILNYVSAKIDYKGKFNFIEQKDFHKKVQAKSFLMDTSRLKLLGFEPNYATMESMIDAIL